MKRKSKAIRKDYSKLENDYTNLAYYGILMKDGRTRIDTKRYRKFFEVPDSKIEHRSSVYYIPTKIHRKDYYCNRFFDLAAALKEQWLNEYSRLLKDIKTPKEVEDDARTDGLMDGVLEYDEACMNAMICGMQREGEYRYIIKNHLCPVLPAYDVANRCPLLENHRRKRIQEQQILKGRIRHVHAGKAKEGRLDIFLRLQVLLRLRQRIPGLELPKAQFHEVL